MIPKNTVFIGADVTEEGHRLAFGTNGSENTIADAETWNAIVTWTGAEVTAGCAVGENMVCPALDGRVYVVKGEAVACLDHDDQKAWIYAIAATGPNTAVLGGNNGRLIEIDVQHRSLSPSRLSASGIDRPGRDILHITVGSERILTGKKELALRWDGAKWNSLVSFNKRETFFYGSVVLDQMVWISALGAAGPVLVELPLAGGEPVQHPMPPMARTAAPQIALFRNHLIVGSDAIFVRLPDGWSELVRPQNDNVVGMLPDEAAGTLFVARHTGTSQRVTVPALL